MEATQKEFGKELETLKAENNNTLTTEYLLGAEDLLKKDKDSLANFKGEIKPLTDPATSATIVTSNLKKAHKDVMYWVQKKFDDVDGSGHALFTSSRRKMTSLYAPSIQ